MNDRVLGTIAMICAPALLIEGVLTEALNLEGRQQAILIGVASMVFMAGWICSNTIMRRVRAAGTGKWGRAVLLVQLAGLVLAFLFGLFEATGLLGRDSIIYNATDAAWPLSMLWMLVVGATVIVAGRLEGWRRFAPVLCPFWLLLALGASALFGDQAGVVGLVWSAVFWALLGFAVRDAGEPAGATPEPAVR